MRTVWLCTVILAAVSPLSAQAQTADDQLPNNYVLTIKGAHTGRPEAGGGVLGRRSNGSLLGVDSLPNWSGYFYEPGFDGSDFTQFTWPYTMVGRSPFSSDDEDDRRGRSTTIGAPIVPVNLDLRNFDGSPRYFIFPDGTRGPRMFLDATQYVPPVLKSPIFSNAFFTSSNKPTQYNDAVQRATFFSQADDNWHTILKPRVAPARTMVLIRGTYSFSVNPDGTLRYVLVKDDTFVNALFPPTATDTSTVMGAAEHAGDIRTTDLATFLFPNTYLMDATTGECCTLGFHSYDVEPGDASNGWRERRYVMNYSSWISPGLFGSSFSDITAVSHELAEAFNDPFVNNTTPWWLAPNGLCQNNLETGDVIEGLPNATFPMLLNGFLYHPQNEALLPWFAGVAHSPSIMGAYSYPDTTVLTSPSLPMHVGCPTTP